MASKTQIILVDDLDGGEAEESVTFGLDGVTYEIDLSAKNAEELRESLATWIGHARRVGGRRATGAAKPKAGGAKRTDLGEVRVWAREQGYEVSDRGRISAEILDAYDAAS